MRETWVPMDGTWECALFEKEHFYLPNLAFLEFHPLVCWAYLFWAKGEMDSISDMKMLELCVKLW